MGKILFRSLIIVIDEGNLFRLLVTVIDEENSISLVYNSAKCKVLFSAFDGNNAPQAALKHFKIRRISDVNLAEIKEERELK